MQAIILAAGMGKRLKKLTQDNTKCMVEVNGVTLIERTLHQLDQCGLSRIVIVVGYEGRKLMEYIGGLDVSTPIRYVDNPVYYKTNNIYSLYLAKDYLLDEDTLLLESDIIFEDAVLRALLDDPRETLALVDKYERWMDGTCVTLGEDDSIESFVPGKRFRYEDKDKYYKTVNLYKFGRNFSVTHYVPFLEAYSTALGNNEYYEQVLRVITMLDDPVIRAKRLNGERWYEIDDIQDLDIASSLFDDNDEHRVSALCSRYGGYWRYPRMLDFCYLVNPYYPPKQMINEMKASFEALLTQYPSGIRVNSLLAGNMFGVDAEHILVGNGASELIKVYMEQMDGTIGIVRPTFEEYPNRLKPERCCVYEPQDFAYGADDLIAYFTGRSIESLVLINPDNPTGNYLSHEEVIKLAQWCRTAGIHLVLDESFADFAEEQDNTMIQDELLVEYPNMVVVKSISKSYGVPGARLGVMASADRDLISSMKKDVAIWNINSFGEYFLQIQGKYKKDYDAALAEFRATRSEFLRELENIPGLKVYPTQANYCMAELTGEMTAKELTRRLLLEHSILIKDLSGKIKREGRQFVRLAIRTRRDNERLLQSLRDCL